MKVLIVDDEPIARQVVREHLEDLGGIEIVGEASTGAEALIRIEESDPDVVLLDLQMPEIGGLALARILRPQRRPLLVYITAFEKHALDAFETGAVDYLLKPIRRDRLAAALEKARTQLAGVKAQSIKPPAVPPAQMKKLAGRLGTDVHLFDPSEVIAFEADGDIVYLLTAKGRYYANHPLKALEERLDPARFRRIHRKTIVNTDHVRKISPLSSKRWLLKMSNGLEFTVSKRMAGLIRDETRW